MRCDVLGDLRDDLAVVNLALSMDVEEIRHADPNDAAAEGIEFRVLRMKLNSATLVVREKLNSATLVVRD